MTIANSVTNEMYANYTPCEVPDKYFYDKVEDFVYVKKPSVYHVHEATCLKCGATFEPALSEVKCPKCGLERNPLDIRGGTDSMKDVLVFKFENTDLPDKSLLVRVFFVQCKHPRVKAPVYCKSTSDTIYDVREAYRIFMGKQRVVFEGANGIFKNVARRLGAKAQQDCLFNLHDWKWDGYTHCANTDEELKDIIDKSFFGNTAAAATMGLIPNTKKLFHKSKLDFFHAWYKNHAISQAYNDGLYNIVYEMGTSWAPWHMKMPGATPKRMLQLNNHGYQIAKASNPRLDDVEHLRTIVEHEPTLVAEDYCRLANTIPPKNIAALSAYGIPCVSILSYLNEQHATQNLSRTQASEFWSKYLALVQKLGYDMSNQEILYPKDVEEALLVAEHRVKKHNIA